MRRGFRRGSMTVAAAVVAAVLAVGVGGANAAPPSVSDQEHRLADQIADGVHSPSATPITDSTIADPRSIAADTAGNGPAQNSWLTATARGLTQPDAAPPGTNDWGCRPTRAHPEPIVLVHGTWVNAYETFAYLSGPLKNAGYCVFTLNYGRENVLDGGGLGTVLPGRSGVGDMAVSAQQVGA
ncbi:esterase/lipase family protein, partial [Nocardia gipuzkoensis]